jgi:hypothetical protein
MTTITIYDEICKHLIKINNDKKEALLIGSRALNYWFPDAREVKGRDWDLIATPGWILIYLLGNNQKDLKLELIIKSSAIQSLIITFPNNVKIDIFIAVPGNAYEMLLKDFGRGKLPLPPLINKLLVTVAEPNILYLLKRTHIIWPYKFDLY